jgi:hypothetical protein
MSTPNEDDDFLLGFNDTTTVEPQNAPNAGAALDLDEQPSTNTDAQAQPAQKEAGKAEEPKQEEDPFAGLPQAVKDVLASVPRMATELETLRRSAGMVPALQSKIDRLEAGAKATSTVTPPTEPKRFTKVEKLREELPDIAEALDEIAAALPSMTAPKAEDLNKGAPEVKSPESDPAIEALDEVRPEWAKDLFSTECQLWMSRLPADRQQEIRSTNRPGVILNALKEFDAHTSRQQTAQQSNNDRQRRMAAAVTPRGDGRASRATAVDDEDADMEAGFYGRR